MGMPTPLHSFYAAPVEVVVLEHMAGGHPWFLLELLEAAGGTAISVRPDCGDSLPAAVDLDALWVMGGAPQVWQEEEHPWLVGEKRLIREAVGAGVPFLGVCLGHQLLASALGGDVGPARDPEVGLFPVEATAAGRDSPWLRGVDTGARFQWHEAEVLRAPAEATVLARSQRCAVQALAVGDRALSVQYHAEVAAGMLPTWCETETTREKLDRVFGPDGLGHFQGQTLAALPALQDHTRRLFANWWARVAD